MSISFAAIPALEKIAAMTPEERAEHDAWVDKENAKAADLQKQSNYEKAAPRRYWQSSLDTYTVSNPEQRQALQAVRQFVGDIKGGQAANLALIGRAGTGKTHLACGALRECGGRYYAASELAERMHRAHGFSTHETEADILKECTECTLLVIDEVGRGASPDDEKYAIYKIINERYNERRGTLLVSNFKAAEFYKYIGAAVADRFNEGGAVFEFINTPSYRQRGGRI